VPLALGARSALLLTNRVRIRTAVTRRPCARTREEDAKPELHRYLRDMRGRVQGERELLRDEVDDDGWRLLRDRHLGLLQRLAAECRAIADRAATGPAE
jgi:hypothetical protein